MTRVASRPRSIWRWARKRLSLDSSSRWSLVFGRWQMRTLISFRLRLGVLAILAIAALPCFAAENAVLRNGFSIRHERREVVRDITRLYVTADGSSFVGVPTAEIEHFEPAPE